MRTRWIVLGLAVGLGVAGCAGDSDLILERKGNELTVRIPEGNPGAAHRAARDACALDRKNASIIGVSADRLKFVCQPF